MMGSTGSLGRRTRMAPIASAVLVLLVLTVGVGAAQADATFSNPDCWSCHDAHYHVAEGSRYIDCSLSGCHDPDWGVNHFYDIYSGAHGSNRSPSDPGYDCVWCHEPGSPGVPHHQQDGITAAHTSPTTTCSEGGCHATLLLVDAHAEYVGSTGRYPQYPDTCALCHLNEDAGRVPPDATADCASCHPDRVAFHGYEVAQHTATLGAGGIALFDDHDGWMGPVGAWMSCADCHSANLGPMHAGLCSTCHPTPRDALVAWDGGCTQGGCHQSYHASGFDHDAVASGNCSACHDEAFFVLYDDPCVACHGHPEQGDTTPPTTDAQILSYFGGTARIAFEVTDGGKVGIGMTFSRLDGGTARVGDSLDVTEPGEHTLEYWSVDQFGNAESPHHHVTFTVGPDTTPPLTTADVKNAYEGPVTIALAATDASYLGVKGTYYALNGGPVKTGTAIAIPQPTSGTVSYTLEYWSDDFNGNVEPRHTAHFTVTRDVTPPVSTLDGLPYYKSATLTIPFNATDTGSGVRYKYYRVDGGQLQFLTLAYNVTRTFSTQGPHTVEYWSVDKVGNSEPHRFVSFVVDWTPPTVTADAVAQYPEEGAVISISATDQPSAGAGPPSVRYRLDGGAEVASGSHATVSATTHGIHQLEYWAVDKAGNASPHTTVTFQVGTTPDPTGFGTLRLTWSSGQPPPYSWADWTVRSGGETGPIIASGSGSQPGYGGQWDGIDDVVVPAQAEAYWVRIEWYDDWWPEYGVGVTTHFPVYVTYDGQLVQLGY